jgi:hypothetical protein
MKHPVLNEAMGLVDEDDASGANGAEARDDFDKLPCY